MVYFPLAWGEDRNYYVGMLGPGGADGGETKMGESIIKGARLRQGGGPGRSAVGGGGDAASQILTDASDDSVRKREARGESSWIKARRQEAEDAARKRQEAQKVMMDMIERLAVTDEEAREDLPRHITDRNTDYVKSVLPAENMPLVKKALEVELGLVGEVCGMLSRAPGEFLEDQGYGHYKGSFRGLGQLSEDEKALALTRLVERGLEPQVSRDSWYGMIDAYHANRLKVLGQKSPMIGERRGSTKQRLKYIEDVVDYVANGGSSGLEGRYIEYVGEIITPQLVEKVRINSAGFRDAFVNEGGEGGGPRVEEVYLQEEGKDSSVVWNTIRRKKGEAIMRERVRLPENVGEGVLIKVDVGQDFPSEVYYVAMGGGNRKDDPGYLARVADIGERESAFGLGDGRRVRFVKTVAPDMVDKAIKSGVEVVDLTK